MKIGLIGGTGDLGEGLALRWGRGTEHALLVGSRRVEKARERAGEFAGKLERAGGKAGPAITGVTNEEAAGSADVAVLCVEAPHALATLQDLRGAFGPGRILVTPAVSMVRKGGVFYYAPPEEGSMALQLAGVLPEGVPLVSAFHTVPAHKLSDLSAKLDQHVVVLGDDRDAKRAVMGLVEAIEGLVPLDGGPLATSALVESITPLLINLAIVNKRKNLAIKFV